MTKQEKIQEAYGEYWEVLKSHIDENGWDTDLKFYEIDYERFDFKVKGHGVYITRPIELKEIEQNNGWVKIESEEDFPVERGQYFGLVNGSVQIIGYNPEFKKWMALGHYYFSNYKDINLTHYQPIQKPKPPIY